MNITHEQLKRIIKEELEATLNEGIIDSIQQAILKKMLGDDGYKEYQKNVQDAIEATGATKDLEEPRVKPKPEPKPLMSDISRFEKAYVAKEDEAAWEGLVDSYDVASITDEKIQRDVMFIFNYHVRTASPMSHPLDYKITGGIDGGRTVESSPRENRIWRAKMKAHGAKIS